MDESAFVDYCVGELREIGLLARDAEVLDSLQTRTRKAYPAYFGTYARFDEVKNFLCGIDNLYCIGRNGQHRYNNMDHSMVTAMVACEGILQGVTDKTALWDVNTEKSYHETKQK